MQHRDICRPESAVISCSYLVLEVFLKPKDVVRRFNSCCVCVGDIYIRQPPVSFLISECRWRRTLVFNCKHYSVSVILFDDSCLQNAAEGGISKCGFEFSNSLVFHILSPISQRLFWQY